MLKLVRVKILGNNRYIFEPGAQKSTHNTCLIFDTSDPIGSLLCFFELEAVDLTNRVIRWISDGIDDLVCGPPVLLAWGESFFWFSVIFLGAGLWPSEELTRLIKAVNLLVQGWHVFGGLARRLERPAAQGPADQKSMTDSSPSNPSKAFVQLSDVTPNPRAQRIALSLLHESEERGTSSIGIARTWMALMMIEKRARWSIRMSWCEYKFRYFSLLCVLKWLWIK